MKPALLFFFLSICAGAAAADEVLVAELFEPAHHLEMKPGSTGENQVERVGVHWHIRGDSPLHLRFVPASGEKWDLSGHRLAGIRVINYGGGIATLVGRLQNRKATGWSDHAGGFCVAPLGEEATLGFPFPVSEDRYTGPAVFKDQLGKANGHRLHWRAFDPMDVRSLALELRSSTGKVNVVLSDLFAAWPSTAELDARLETMPYLDEMGQVNAVDWPGKAHSLNEARAGLLHEYEAAATAAMTRRCSTYGGWAEGPRREATGRFRTEKVDGKWWLIDPEGYLFYSVGACLAGNRSETEVKSVRREAGFFSYIPDKEDPLCLAGLKWEKGRQIMNYPALNYARFFGEGWEERSRKGDHDRMQAWGVNTLGCWSDEAMQKDRRTAFTLIASPWWNSGNLNSFPSPFSDDFETQIHAGLKKHLWAKDEPFLLGVFLGNELDWPAQISPLLFELDAGHPTKEWAIGRMREKYGELEALNAVWGTHHEEWSAILRERPAGEISGAVLDDLEPLYLDFATAFFKRCKAALESVLPGTLYLGCRNHKGPKVLGQAAVGHVDVFSVNVYDSRVSAHQLSTDVDLPVLASEFHFGAVDRGVPSPGLSGVWDQRQRGLAFAHYLASALADPRFVGVHWFQWLDQSAAGRPDRENHSVGFLDVTGRSHREFVDTVCRATRALYQVRTEGEASTEQILEGLIWE